MSTVFQTIFLLVFVQIIGIYVSEKIRYVATERPNVVYYNPKYFRYFNITCRRHSRTDPIYYFEAHFYAKYICPGNLTGRFDLYNMSIPHHKIPFNFPFSKGRISLNLTSTNAAKDSVFYGHVDMEIKEFNVRPRKN